jgi:hypothetical protein
MGFEIFTEANREPAECLVMIDDLEITDLYPFLTEIRADISRTDASVATLSFESRREVADEWVVQDYEMRGSALLKPWRKIKIEVAFGNRTEEVFRGFIREVKTDYPEDAGAAMVNVECQDDSMLLDRMHRRRAWGSDTPSSDSLILLEMLNDYSSYGLMPHPENGPGQSEIEVNQDETDISFLKKRAEENDYELFFSEGLIYFGPPRLQSDPQPTIKVYAGMATNCLSISVNGDGHQADKVGIDVPDAQGSASTEELIEPDLEVLGPEHASSAEAGLDDLVWKMQGQAGSNIDELRARAQRKANEFDLNKVKGEGELDGVLYGHVLRVGELVPVDGIGQRMNGTYYVDKVTHAINYEGYRQQFNLLRNAYGDNLDSLPGLGVLTAVI